MTSVSSAPTGPEAEDVPRGPATEDAASRGGGRLARATGQQAIRLDRFLARPGGISRGRFHLGRFSRPWFVCVNLSLYTV
jgi:hypothetical protein